MTLELYRGDELALTRGWTALVPEERRRRAVSALADHDLPTLQEAQHRRHGRVSAETLRKYRLGARTWLQFAWEGAVNALHPTPEHADLWVRQLERAGKAPSSVAVFLAGARALYAALRWAGATRDDPFTDTAPHKDKRRPWDKRQPYSEADVERLLAAAPTEMRVLLRLGGLAGLRASEIVNITWGDLNPEADTLTVNGKGGKVRRVLLAGTLVHDLKQLGPRSPEAAVIGRTPEAARHRLRTLCARVGVAYLGLHALRHTAGTRLIRAGFQLQDVAEHLGHSDVQTARVYGKWADERLKTHMQNS